MNLWGLLLVKAGALLFAGMVLGLSLFRQSQQQALSLVVPEELQVAIESSGLLQVGAGNKGENRLKKTLVVWSYYPEVLSDRWRWGVTRDVEKKVMLAVELAKKRMAMALVLNEQEKPVLALQTVNKGMHYLDDAYALLIHAELETEQVLELYELVYGATVAQEQTFLTLKGRSNAISEPVFVALYERVWKLQAQLLGEMEELSKQS